MFRANWERDDKTLICDEGRRYVVQKKILNSGTPGYLQTGSPNASAIVRLAVQVPWLSSYWQSKYLRNRQTGSQNSLAVVRLAVQMLWQSLDCQSKCLYNNVSVE